MKYDYGITLWKTLNCGEGKKKKKMEHKSRLIFKATRWHLIPLVQIACIFYKEWIFFFKTNYKEYTFNIVFEIEFQTITM